VGGLYAALSEVLTMGPRWLFPSVVVALLIPNIVSHHTDGAFLFPQMTMSEAALRQSGQRRWSPNFIDYLFLAPYRPPTCQSWQGGQKS
jgi:hypothetical protein